MSEDRLIYRSSDDRYLLDSFSKNRLMGYIRGGLSLSDIALLYGGGKTVRDIELYISHDYDLTEAFNGIHIDTKNQLNRALMKGAKGHKEVLVRKITKYDAMNNNLGSVVCLLYTSPSPRDS